MIFELRGYRLELVDEPLVRHCIAFERAARAAKGRTITPQLKDALEIAQSVSPADNDALGAALTALNRIAASLREAIEIATNAETLTASADDAAIVRAAVASGWVISCKYEESDVPLDNPDNISPPWLCGWIARRVMEQYVEAVTIPKN